MATHGKEMPRTDVAPDAAAAGHPNGGSLAAFLAAGIGSFAMGAFVILNAAGIFAAPSFYAPVGGLSGRSTLAVVVWVVAWFWLHRRWRGREMEARTVYLATFALTALGVLATFPPLWELL
jgi:asparagine N-glycosylation enzyme membrane subunit Stt3